MTPYDDEPFSDNLKPKRKNRMGRSWRFWAILCLFTFFLGFFGAIATVFLLRAPSANDTVLQVPTGIFNSQESRLTPQAILPQDLGTDADVRLDVAFVIDTTGSMSDELAQLQNNILYISEQISKLAMNVHVRYAYVAYKDFGDSYLTNAIEFTSDVSTFQVNLQSLYADGGGDTPEALQTALDVAVSGLSWRDENTVKLVFIVTDAAPTLQYPEQEVPYVVSIQRALNRAIKIHTIASSGLDPVGEFALRQISQATFGQFIFLTYDESGTAGTSGDYRPDLQVGEPATANSNGDFTVQQLDKIVLRLITQELLQAMN